MTPPTITPLDCLAVTVNAVDAFTLWEIQRRYREAEAERFDLKWCVASNAEIAAAIPPITARQAHLSLQRLKKGGLIDSIPGRNRKTGAAVSTWYRLTNTCQQALAAPEGVTEAPEGVAEGEAPPEGPSGNPEPSPGPKPAPKKLDPEKAMAGAWFGPPEAQPKP